MPCKTKILRYCDRWIVVQRLTFDSMYRVLDLEPGCIGGAGGEDSRVLEQGFCKRTCEKYGKLITLLIFSSLLCLPPFLLSLFIPLFVCSIFLFFPFSRVIRSIRSIYDRLIRRQQSRLVRDETEIVLIFFSLRTYGYMNHSSGARKTR